MNIVQDRLIGRVDHFQRNKPITTHQQPELREPEALELRSRLTHASELEHPGGQPPTRGQRNEATVRAMGHIRGADVIDGIDRTGAWHHDRRRLILAAGTACQHSKNDYSQSPHHRQTCAPGSLRDTTSHEGVVAGSRPVGGILSGSPLPGSPWMTIHLCDLPGSVCGRAALSLLDLAPGGVCLAAPVARSAGALLPHRFTLADAFAGGLFSVALSCESPRLAVSQHPALRSPDLPRSALADRGHPAGSPPPPPG